MSAIIAAGYKAKLFWIEEVTEGTAPSGGTPPPTYNASYVFVEERISRDLITHPTIGGRDWAFLEHGLKVYRLNVTHFPTSNSLLDYAVSKIDKSLTFWIKYPDLTVDHVFTACKVNSLRLTGSAGTNVQAVLDVWAAKLSTTAPTATEGTLPTTTPYHGRDGYVKINAVTVPEVRAWSVDINNNLEAVPQLGSDEIRFSRERNRVVTGELTATFESTARLNELLNSSYFNLEIGLGKEGATTRTLSISNCKWREHPIPVRKTDLIMLRLPFTGTTPTLA